MLSIFLKFYNRLSNYWNANMQKIKLVKIEIFYNVSWKKSFFNFLNCISLKLNAKTVEQ